MWYEESCQIMYDHTNPFSRNHANRVQSRSIIYRTDNPSSPNNSSKPCHTEASKKPRLETVAQISFYMLYVVFIVVFFHASGKHPQKKEEKETVSLFWMRDGSRLFAPRPGSGPGRVGLYGTPWDPTGSVCGGCPPLILGWWVGGGFDAPTLPVFLGWGAAPPPHQGRGQDQGWFRTPGGSSSEAEKKIPWLKKRLLAHPPPRQGSLVTGPNWGGGCANKTAI